MLILDLQWWYYIIDKNYFQNTVIGNIWESVCCKSVLMLGKIEGRRRRGCQRMRRSDGITDAMNKNLGKLWETVRDREAWRAVVHGVTKSWIRLGNWTTTATTFVNLIWRYTQRSPCSWKIFLHEKWGQDRDREREIGWKWPGSPGGHCGKPRSVWTGYNVMVIPF